MEENNGKEVARLPTNLPAMVDAKQYGVDLGEEDQVMPRLALVQPTSKVEGAGKFHYTLTGELFESVDMIVFSNARGRVMFDPDMSKQQSICGSNDRLVPSPRFETPKASSCIKCNFSNRNYQEKVIIGGKEIPTYCSETQTLRAMFADSLWPFLFVGRRTSLMPVNEWLSIMQFECAKNKKPLCCFPVRLTSKLINKVNQKYYVPHFERLGMIEKEEFTAMMNKYKDYNPDKTYDAEEKQGKAVNEDEPTPF